MTPNKETTTFNDAPEDFENNLKTILISGIMELTEQKQIELWKELSERGIIKL